MLEILGFGSVMYDFFFFSFRVYILFNFTRITL